MTVQKTKYRSMDDIKKRFPYPEDLVFHEGAYWYKDKVIVPADKRDQVLSAVWADMPSSTGRIRFYAYIRCVCVS